MNKELHAYIINQLQRGIPQEEITNTLLANGWQIKDIYLAWLQITNPNYKEEDLENTKNQPLPNGTSDAKSLEKNKVKKPHLFKVLLEIVGAIFAMSFFLGGYFLLMFILGDFFNNNPSPIKSFVQGGLLFFVFFGALFLLWKFRRNSKK